MTASRRSAAWLRIVNMQLGEVIFGGVGCGLYGMLLFAIVALFIAGLMVGRTPEYLGKKLEVARGEDGHAGDAVDPAVGARLHRTWRRCCRRAWRGPRMRVRTASARSSTPSPRMTANNGSAFAGLTGNTTFYNLLGAIAMMIGRFAIMVPVLAIAGSLAAKKLVPASAGTFPTDNGLFVGLAARRDHHHRRPDLFPGRCAGALRRAPADAGRLALLR